MKSSYRTEGWSAIGSGVFGILAICSLLGYLVLRDTSEAEGILISRVHDAAAVFQFILMIPVAFGLRKLSQKSSGGMSKAIFNTGIVAICFAALFLLLIFPKIVSDILYMIPQGVFGIWLMIVNWRLKKLIHPFLRWFGIVVGLGLALVGTFPLGFAIFVNMDSIRIPAAPPMYYPATSANMFLHQILYTGSFMGVFTLPVWTILTGRGLLLKSHNAESYPINQK